MSVRSTRGWSSAEGGDDVPVDWADGEDVGDELVSVGEGIGVALAMFIKVFNESGDGGVKESEVARDEADLVGFAAVDVVGKP